MNATNTFQNGLVTDSHPLAVSNDTLTNCLNGTLITYNGNELILQNDVGNSKIIYKDEYNTESEVTLTLGFIPIGMKSYGGIIYIFSHNPSTLEGEIGTFPSPDYSKGDVLDDFNTIHNLQYTYRPLHNLIKTTENNLKVLCDLRTKEFTFDLEHPVLIDFLMSYDLSVNIIFNDGKNLPRLINNGFAPYGNNEVKIIKRDLKLLETNVYEEDNFKYNVSLTRICNSIVEIEFLGELESGNLPVGNYTFYFKVADSDGNESDFIGLSGLVVCHKGRLNDPKSIDGGVAGENSNKTVMFELSKIPRQFTRVYVYYSRYTSTSNGVLSTEYKKIVKYFDLSEVDVKTSYRKATINITGYEDSIDIDLNVINSIFTTPTIAKTLAINDNILFLGNINENVSLFDKLRDYSVSWVNVEPSESEDLDEVLYDTYFDYENVFPDISEKKQYGYYNIHNIYKRVGYWPEEYYRFGIVYILDDYTTTPVFNIRGSLPYEGKDYNEYGIIQFKKLYFKQFTLSDTQLNNNVVHVLLFPKFTIDRERLPKGVIGCFFVRQKRLKNIIGLALQIGTDSQYTHIPVLWCGKKRKWITQSFLLGSDEINNKPTFTDSVKTVSNPNDTVQLSDDDFLVYDNDSDSELKEKPIYFRHDYYREMGSVRSHFDTPDDIKLGPSWITNIYSSMLRVFGPEESDLDYTIKKDAAIMPEFELKLGFYGSMFTGGKFKIELVVKFNNLYFPRYTKFNVPTTSFRVNPIIIVPINPTLLDSESEEANIISVFENSSVKAGDRIYKAVAGNASEPSLAITPFTDKIIIDRDIAAKDGNHDFYDSVGFDHEGRKGLGHTCFSYQTRGIFSPYLGLYLKNLDDFKDYTLINIKTPNTPSPELLVNIRRLDNSEFYPIGKRINFLEDDRCSFKCFGGDCFIGNFTHRMLRNFIDPEFPIQDDIAQIYNWSFGKRVNAYDKDDSDNINYYDLFGEVYILSKDTYSFRTDLNTNLNRADINSVPLGLWITFKFYSSLNPCMRSSDGSVVSEKTVFNQNRKFYPTYNVSLTKNTNKLSDSYLYNEGYELSLGKHAYVLYPEVPAINEEFSNRIIYSNVDVDSLITNNLRTFKNNAYRDYTKQYGKIVKIVPWLSEAILIIIFEHGIGYVAVNEKAPVSELASKTIYLETNKILGDLTTISEKYGSLWPESIVDVPTGIYGIDASAKKIWKYGTLFECISDLKVNKFIKDNLVTNEISNLVNVLNFNIKTHYNAHKQDIMFTFYRNLEDGTLIAWNLCYNEVTKKMTTFYSWIPLASENINKTFYSIEFKPEMAYNYMFKKDISEYVLNIWEHNKENNWCNWYGLLHPFEFEYVVNSYPNFLKIYNNLLIIANKTVPESFHFEIVGEGYDFSKDKKNMYHRLEATKSFYDWCMSRIMADDKKDKILYDKKAVEDVYLNNKLKLNEKSAIFPLKVKRLDFNNIIYDIYKLLTSKSLDYQSLSGSEIVYDSTTNDYLIDTHIKAIPKGGFIWQTICRTDDDNVNKIANYYVNHGVEIRIDGEYLLKKVLYDLRLSNCKYVEDCWKVLIPSINYYEKNEDWSKTNNRPPINLVTDPVPENLSKYSLLPINSNYPVEVDNWVVEKLTKLRDKYIRIKIRYSGDDLAIISGIINIFKETYN